MSDRIRAAGQVAWALMGLTVVLLVLGYVAWYIRVVWPPLLLAGIIVFILNPVVTLLARHHVPRVVGTALAYVLFLGGLVLAGVLIAPQARDQWDDLATTWEDDLRPDIEEWMDERAVESEEEGWPVQIPTFQELEDSLLGNNGDDDAAEEEDTADRFLAQIDTAREVGMRLLNVGLILLMAPIIAFYLLIDLPHIRRVIESLIPEQRKAEALLVGRRLNRAIGGYFRGQLVIATIVGVLSGLGMWAIGLPFALVIGVITGVTNLIPMIGPWVGGVPAVIIALTMEDVTTAIWAVLILFVVQQVESSWISPVIMKRAVKLHPAVVMLALLAGGTLFGFIGLLLAVPVMAVLKVLIGHLWRTYVLGQPLEVSKEAFEAMDSQRGGIVVDVDHRNEELDRVAFPVRDDEDGDGAASDSSGESEGDDGAGRDNADTEAPADAGDVADREDTPRNEAASEAENQP
jgi:predicted PurR-regulated permease PerM